MNKINNKKKKIFLGGTCADSNWRNTFIPMLNNINMDYFNPLTNNWNDETRKQEIYEREHDDFILYVLSRVNSTYSIAEVVDDSNKRPEKTICCVLNEDIYINDNFKPNHKIIKKSLTNQEFKHLDQVGKLCERNGAKYFNSLEDIIEFLIK